MKFSFQLANRTFSFSLNHQPSTPQPSTRSTPDEWLRAEDQDRSDGAILHSAYSQSSWVYIAISVIAETIAQIPFRIARVGKSSSSSFSSSSSVSSPLSPFPPVRSALGEHVVDQGPIIDLFIHPHPTMDRSLFWELLTTWRCLRGEFFILPLDASDQ